MKVLCIKSFKGELSNIFTLPNVSPEVGDVCEVQCVREKIGFVWYYLGAPFEGFGWSPDHFMSLEEETEFSYLEESLFNKLNTPI